MNPCHRVKKLPRLMSDSSILRRIVPLSHSLLISNVKSAVQKLVGVVTRDQRPQMRYLITTKLPWTYHIFGYDFERPEIVQHGLDSNVPIIT